MGVLQYYTRLCRDVTITQQETLKDPEEEFKGNKITNDAVDITLAEYDVDTKDVITAHHLKDYRRRHFDLVLLPKVDTLFDKILEGSSYWYELLHNESGHA